jgi:hypothetical protein
MDRQSSGPNSGQFLPGHPRPVGSGRQKGTPNKQTVLIRAGLQSALEALRGGNGQNNPVQSALKIARTLEEMTVRRCEKFEDEAGNLPPAEFDRVIGAMKIAADIHLRLADFAFPKLARIDVAGEAPALPVQQKVIVTLNIPRPPGAKGAIEHNADPEAVDGTIRSSDQTSGALD